MINFNIELQKLIQRANEYGYELKDDEFTKIKNEKVPVIETLFINNSVMEESGSYHLYHNTSIIDKDEFRRVYEYGSHHNNHEFHCNDETCNAYEFCCMDDICNTDTKPEDEIIDLIYEIFQKYDKSKEDYTHTNEGGVITVEFSTTYRIYFSADTCINFWFSKKDSNDDFPIGCISFYYMDMADFERRKNTDVDITVRKFMRNN